ncbi:hypothetical protein CGRA01v4_01895 [Colletotrichum graminicola]|nr:hypothetical protein CGRA01v4_01895 [Colletotrichum graminicola]
MPCCVLYHAVLYRAAPMLTRARTLGFGCRMGKETRPSEDNPYVKNRAHLSRLFTIHFFSLWLTISDGGVGLQCVGHLSAPKTTSSQRVRDGTRKVRRVAAEKGTLGGYWSFTCARGEGAGQ